MFERFTERARQVVVLAQDEARIVRHNYIGTEHMLLGLLRENEGVAVRILLDLGVDAEKIRHEIVRKLGPSPASSLAFQRVPRSSASLRNAVPSVGVLIAAWVLGAVTLGAGILVGWAIWG